MSSAPNFDCWGVLIDTDAYAGNFEREMCAHCTGHYGECEVGLEFAEQIDEFEDAIISIPDEHGCHRPCTLWDTPGGEPNAVLIYFESRPTDEQIAIIKERAQTFLHRHAQIKDPIFKLELTEILGFRTIQFRMHSETAMV